jgi:uncharacterized protein
MHLYTIPYQDKYIIYRPLRRLAFVGNRAMRQLCERVQMGPAIPVQAEEADAYRFLETIGFLEEDPPFPEEVKDSETFQPTVCVLFPTNQCNLRCIYCYANGGDNRPETMPVSMARAAIDQVCENALSQGLERYSLCFHGGGEPTMAWPLLQSCVAYARQKELPAEINLTSNGIWNEGQRSWLLDHIDEISLSFDGLPEIQNRQRPLRAGGPSYPMVMESIRKLERRNKSYGIRVTVTDESISQLADMVTFLCRETGAQTLQVEPAFNHGRARMDGQTLMQNERFAEAFLAGYDIARQHNRHMYYSGSRPWLLTNRFCDAFAKALVVGPDGFITACYEVCSKEHDLSGVFHFGELIQEGRLSLNWQMRENFLSRIAERKKNCRGCFCYFHCAGDCPSKTFTPEPDGHLQHSSRCDLNRLITKELILRSVLEGNGVWQGDQQREYSIVGPEI